MKGRREKLNKDRQNGRNDGKKVVKIDEKQGSKKTRNRRRGKRVKETEERRKEMKQ
jgi:hypothetical protein